MNPVNLLTGIAVRATGSAIADKQKVTTSPPSPNPSPRLPLVLPQERWHPDAPFVRATSTALPLDPAEVARALDGVNEALVPSPRATAVQFGSIAAGLLIPGLCTVAAAVVGSAAHIGGATDRVKAVQDAVDRANLIFLHELLGLPSPDAEALVAEEASSDDESDSVSTPKDEKPKDKQKDEKHEKPEDGEHEKPKDEEAKDGKGKGKRTPTPLPLGLDRLRPYAAHTLPIDIDLGPATYTHEGRTDRLSTLAARGQVAKSTWNERRGSRSRTGRKRRKLVGDAIWFVVM